MSEDIKAIDTIVNELRKIREKYEKRAEREREKVSNVYVTVKGEKCYTEDDINAWYQCDYITSSQCDKFATETKYELLQWDNVPEEIRPLRRYPDLVLSRVKKETVLLFLRKESSIL